MIGKVNFYNAQDVTTSKSQTVKQSAKTSSPATQANIPKTLAATGLPADKLSASIISFARFFSLPLKPALLADIRRQALLPQPQSNTTQQAAPAHHSAANPTVPGESAQMQKSIPDVKTREAFTLAAAAAESKGVELNQKGLESYAEAVDPDRRRQNDEDRKRGRRDKNQNEDEKLITADSLKKMALNNLEKDTVLEIMNKLPGKNSQRWIVLPFDFTEGDRDYFVSMRILLEGERTQAHRATGSHHVCFMVLDVLEDKNGERRVFVFESSGEKINRVSVCVWEELAVNDQRKLKDDVSKLFNVPAERVNIRVCEESFPFESAFGEKHPSIDEAV